ncbi:replication-associated recombination protein A [Azospirillum baldaniorum]|uniref:Replication-associated recombination protein A n=1 Tax=Azospirillum baldaniorum TaxID=1064539 RepID=A0A9P1NM34_9PROT|nr:replication-associated recombination protein A [Azospirillum baldaniorum]AWJ90145.1 replication-associated recombination protein A [Azospirillum baldaniorum]TWA77311.1 recombination protein MgsA [Azospirillum brasilense]CCC97797.1 replication-associated recombination protein A [Azospirillum baldaniorum]
MSKRGDSGATGGLFEAGAPRPLADRLRPRSLGEVVGQEHLLKPDGPLGRMVAARRLASMILWGPPGCGKTTIARLLALSTDLHFEPLSAVFSGVADLRKVFDAARARRAAGQGTLLFIDEIHRFNRSQQDGFLPYVEDGTVTLVGATTENPSFELNAALLSRAQVFVLNRLDDAALEKLLSRAEAEMGRPLPLTPDARAALKAMADGDGRFCLNLCEELFALPVPEDGALLDNNALATAIQRRAPLYDKAQEGHYNLISALHKSLRGSDTDAALYWYARMLEGGEDPRYIARRLTRFAVEDIGMADPNALAQATAAWEAYERLGSPEGELAIAQLVIYLGTAPKSNAGYTAYKSAVRAAKETGSLMPPKHILNAPTKLMKQIGYGKGYEYDHDTADGFSGQNYFPEGMARRAFYQPVERGFEREIKKRQDYWGRLRERKAADGDE